MIEEIFHQNFVIQVFLLVERQQNPIYVGYPSFFQMLLQLFQLGYAFFIQLMLLVFIPNCLSDFIDVYGTIYFRVKFVECFRQIFLFLIFRHHSNHLFQGQLFERRMVWKFHILDNFAKFIFSRKSLSHLARIFPAVSNHPWML